LLGVVAFIYLFINYLYFILFTKKRKKCVETQVLARLVSARHSY